MEDRLCGDCVERLHGDYMETYLIVRSEDELEYDSEADDGRLR